MAESRPFKKSFAVASQGGPRHDIEMPPLDQSPPIAQAQDPWVDQKPQQSAFSVPDSQQAQELAGAEFSQEEPVTENVETADPEALQQVQQTTVVPKKEDHPNFKAIREAKERAEQERDLLLRKMMEMEQYVKAQQAQAATPPAQDDTDPDFDIDADALVEGKSLKKVASRIKKLESQLKESQVRNHASMTESRLKSQYPDIEQVLSGENIAQLNEMYPEIARTIGSTQDMYDKGVAAYTMIKNLGIHKDKILEQEKVRAIANTQKPRPLASVSPQQGDSPLSKANAFANGLTDEMKEQLRKEMYAARRSL